MIVINVKWPVKPELADAWPELVAEFTAAVRAEPGNVSFDWSRSAEDPDTWFLLECFRDAEAGAAHVASDHFRKAISEMPDRVSAQPQIIFVEAPDVAGWGPMGEVRPR
ncbi:antibiotic biosynthesis monooxygenase [Kineococcus sp. NBC_00420]|uniref:putative quinol monooxygenase n=1 Tax=unclassified Kineococcus TaxID=2621656 RepID=UPI002E225154